MSMTSVPFKPSSYSSSSHNNRLRLLFHVNTPLQCIYCPLSSSSSSSSSNCRPLKRPLFVACKCKYPLPLEPHSGRPYLNYSLPLNPFPLFSPILQIIKSFTAKAAAAPRCRWGAYLQDPAIDYIRLHDRVQVLHGGGIGMALLTVKSTARDRFSPFMATLAANPTFVSGLLAWFLAQSVKVILNFFLERKWDLRLLCASGGMPSSHSALCTALTTSVALCHGVADSLFPVCLGFSLIVMYDAIGVRRHAGMQAEVLNKIIEDLFQGHPISERKLKELLGHTPSQVVAGALLGIVVACFCCQGCLVPT